LLCNNMQRATRCSFSAVGLGEEVSLFSSLSCSPHVGILLSKDMIPHHIICCHGSLPDTCGHYPGCNVRVWGAGCGLDLGGSVFSVSGYLLPLLTSADSIKSAAKVVARNLLTYYHGDQPGQIPGVLPGPPPGGLYYWVRPRSAWWTGILLTRLNAVGRRRALGHLG
jgi:hypothetical protein